MGRNFIRFVTFLLLPMLSFSKNVPPKSVFDAIFADDQICPTLNFLKNFKVMDGCKQVSYPSEVKIVNMSQKDLFLCLAIYDASHSICHYASLQTSSPKDEVYKKEVEKLIPANPEENFCTKNSLSFAPFYSKTRGFFVQDDPAKEKNPIVKIPEVKCTMLCYKDMAETFNPLCAVLGMENNLIRFLTQESKAPREEIVPASKQETPKDKVTEKANPGNKESSVSAGTGSDTSKPMAQKNANPKTSKPEIKVEDQNKNKDTPGSATSSQVQNPQNPEKSKPQDTKVDVPAPANVEPQGGSPGADTDAGKMVASEGETVKKAESGDKGNTEAKTNAQKPVEAAVKESVNTDDQINEPERSNGAAIEVPASEKKDKNEKPDVISDNTQDGFPSDPDEFEDEPNTRIVEENVDQPKDSAGDKTVKSLETANQQDFQAHYHPKRNDEDESHFFTYFTIISVLCVAGYIGYHNKQKVLAIILEGRRSRGSRGRRRPSTASYRKLDCTLEEAVTSQCNSNVTHVIY